MTNARYPLVVDLLLANARITGLVDLQEERRRLVDLLNSNDGMLVATNVQVMLTGGDTRRLDSLSISKSAVLAAIPRETGEHNRIRAIQRTVVGRTATVQGHMAMFIPPIYIEGVAHNPVGMGRLQPDPRIFSHFFSVTEADLVTPYGTLQQMPVTIVNRDAIVAMSLLGGVKEGDQHAGAQPGEPSALDRLVSNF